MLSNDAWRSFFFVSLAFLSLFLFIKNKVSSNNIIFEENPELIWLKVITSMGINIGSLSNQRGFA